MRDRTDNTSGNGNPDAPTPADAADAITAALSDLAGIRTLGTPSTLRITVETVDGSTDPATVYLTTEHGLNLTQSVDAMAAYQATQVPQPPPVDPELIAEITDVFDKLRPEILTTQVIAERQTILPDVLQALDELYGTQPDELCSCDDDPTIDAEIAALEAQFNGPAAGEQQ